MKKLVCLCVLFYATTLVSSTKKPSEVEAFTNSGITPDVVDIAPSKPLKIEYRKTNKEVNFGNELTPKDVHDAPPVVTYDEEPQAFYTLVMTDPDAPSRKNPVNKEWSHWLVGNIPGSDVEKGETLTEYVGSAPPKGTGLHRYVFLLFKQSGKVTFNEEYKSKNLGKRGKFSTRDFVKKYGLGDPIAGNYFQAQFHSDS